MPLEDLLGRSATLKIRRFASPGAYLGAEDGDDRDVILLVGHEIPEGAKEGDAVDVFIHLDSEGRPLATTRPPKLERDQVAFLRVTACTSIGSFVDWGLAKELLVPFAEQTGPMVEGALYPIGLYVDGSGRLAGTMRIREMLRSDHDFQPGEWVEGEAWRNEPGIGLFVILDKRFIGLVPSSEPHALSRGESASFRVTHVLPDRKIECSLRGPAHEELAQDAERILELLSRPKAPRIGDKSTPDEIRAAVGLSKKAFKRAAGRLLRERTIACDADGFFVRA